MYRKLCKCKYTENKATVNVKKTGHLEMCRKFIIWKCRENWVTKNLQKKWTSVNVQKTGYK